MGRPAPMHLSEDKRDRVQVFVRRGKANARALTRARVLLKSDEGWTDAQIAEVLDISEQTIRNIRQRFRVGGGDRGAHRQAARTSTPSTDRWASGPSHCDRLQRGS